MRRWPLEQRLARVRHATPAYVPPEGANQRREKPGAGPSSATRAALAKSSPKGTGKKSGGAGS